MIASYFFFKLIPGALEGFFGFGSFGEDHEAGGFSIETVDNPDPLFGAGMSLANVFGQLEVGGFSGSASLAMLRRFSGFEMTRRWASSKKI